MLQWLAWSDCISSTDDWFPQLPSFVYVCYHISFWRGFYLLLCSSFLFPFATLTYTVDVFLFIFFILFFKALWDVQIAPCCKKEIIELSCGLILLHIGLSPTIAQLPEVSARMTALQNISPTLPVAITVLPQCFWQGRTTLRSKGSQKSSQGWNYLSPWKPQHCGCL